MNFVVRDLPCPSDRRVHDSKIGMLCDALLQLPVGDKCMELDGKDWTLHYIHRCARLRSIKVRCRTMGDGKILVWRLE